MTTVICYYILFINRRETMNIIISHTSMEPIYEQIVRQIRAKIIDGSLKEKEPLPSVRTLSRELRISALTVKKAYDFWMRKG